VHNSSNTPMDRSKERSKFNREALPDNQNEKTRWS